MSDTVQKPDTEKPAAEQANNAATPAASGSVEPPLISISKGIYIFNLQEGGPYLKNVCLPGRIPIYRL